MLRNWKNTKNEYKMLRNWKSHNQHNLKMIFRIA